MASANGMMTLEQLARYLGLSPRTIYMWAQQEKIPGFKLGSTWRFRVDEIDDWMESQRTGPAVAPQSRLTDAVSPIQSKHRVREFEAAATAAMIADCVQGILDLLRDDTRDVWTTEELEATYELGVVDKAISQLRGEKRISVGSETGLRGKKVKVIRRRS